MPNVAALLKEEMRRRLSRREGRRQLAGMKKASVQYRHHIAALRRQVSNLLRQRFMGSRLRKVDATLRAYEEATDVPPSKGTSTSI
jgi:hypothetical protein